MDPEDRITAEEWGRMRGSSWAAIVLAILGFAAAAGFLAMYLLNYAKTELSKSEAQQLKAELDTKTRQHKETISRLEEELDSKRRKNDSLESETRDLKFKLQGKENLVTTLSDRLEKRDRQIKSLESGNEALVSLRSELADKDVRLNAVVRELENARSSIEKAQAKIATQESEYDRLEKELERARFDLREAQKEAKDATLDRATKDVLQSQLRDREDQIEDLKEKLSERDETFRRREAEINALRETLGKAGREAEELQKKEEELRKLIRESTRKDVQMEGLEAELEQLKGQAANDRSTIDELRNTLAHKGDVSEQVKSLSEALAGKDETIAKKDGEILTLKNKLAREQELSKNQTAVGELDIKRLREERGEKAEKLTALEKLYEELKAEKENITSELESERYAAEIIEKGEELEQVTIRTGFWRTSNAMAVRASDGTLPGTKVDMSGDLNLDMAKGSAVIDMHFSARFGFSLNYEELTFSGRSTMPADERFYGKTFDAGNAVDSEFYVTRAGLQLYFNLGALHKSERRRVDLNLVVGGSYFKVNGRMLDRADGDRADHSLSAFILYPGLKLTCRYRDGITLLAQVMAMSYRYGKYRLRNLVGANLAMDFRIFENFDVEFGYAYKNIHYGQDDTTTGENFHAELASEGPYITFVMTF